MAPKAHLYPCSMVTSMPALQWPRQDGNLLLKNAFESYTKSVPFLCRAAQPYLLLLPLLPAGPS